jgi:type VI secretion system protein ImpK
MAAQNQALQRRGQLALALQEVLTVTVRLRRGETVTSDPGSFRSHVKQLLLNADQNARVFQYPGGYPKLATYAAVAFLDESVLSSRRPEFGSWAGRTLQEEIFGDHMAGENFFRNLEDLLVQHDSDDLADLLEVFQLCLLLGFRGRYAGTGGEVELQEIQDQVGRKIRRIRGETELLAPSWGLPKSEEPPRRVDPWARRMVAISIVMAVAVVALFVTYFLVLRSGLQGVGT